MGEAAARRPAHIDEAAVAGVCAWRGGSDELAVELPCAVAAEGVPVDGMNARRAILMPDARGHQAQRSIASFAMLVEKPHRAEVSPILMEARTAAVRRRAMQDGAVFEGAERAVAKAAGLAGGFHGGDQVGRPAQLERRHARPRRQRRRVRRPPDAPRVQ